MSMARKTTFADRLKALRTDKHMGIRELGRAVGETTKIGR